MEECQGVEAFCFSLCVREDLLLSNLPLPSKLGPTPSPPPGVNQLGGPRAFFKVWSFAVAPSYCSTWNSCRRRQLGALLSLLCEAMRNNTTLLFLLLNLSLALAAACAWLGYQLIQEKAWTNELMSTPGVEEAWETHNAR